MWSQVDNLLELFHLLVVENGKSSGGNHSVSSGRDLSGILTISVR